MCPEEESSQRQSEFMLEQGQREGGMMMTDNGRGGWYFHFMTFFSIAEFG